MSSYAFAMMQEWFASGAVFRCVCCCDSELIGVMGLSLPSCLGDLVPMGERGVGGFVIVACGEFLLSMDVERICWRCFGSVCCICCVEGDNWVA